jgi:hypothetical protein
MVAAQPELTDEERAIIDGAFELADRTLREILVPRTQVVALADDLPAAEAARSSWRPGTPVRRCTRRRRPRPGARLRPPAQPRHPTGHVADHTQDVLVLPETARALDTLRRMQLERQQLAVVINEHGGAEGIITIEDLVEELVGEIWDEADPDIRGGRAARRRQRDAPGSYPIHDLDDLGMTTAERRLHDDRGARARPDRTGARAGESIVVDGVRSRCSPPPTGPSSASGSSRRPSTRPARRMSSARLRRRTTPGPSWPCSAPPPRGRRTSRCRPCRRGSACTGPRRGSRASTPPASGRR